MRIIYNNLIPFKSFSAINLFGVLFVRKGVRVTQGLLNHEDIHTKQMKELGYIGFYLWYLIEWIIRLFQYKGKNAYRNISFEREAYDHDFFMYYLIIRKPYAFLKYLKKR